MNVVCTRDTDVPAFVPPTCSEIRLLPVAKLIFAPTRTTASTSNQRPILPRPGPFTPPSTSPSNGDWARLRGDLRRKIEQRPSRERLVTQHILLSDGRVAPLIEQRARLLRQERIKKNLSRKLKHRPGPLELVTRKILKADEELENAIQEGRLAFQPIAHLEEPSDRITNLITPDMEVVSQVVVRQPTKSINIFNNKGIMRKSPKVSPYKTPEQTQFRSKTKSVSGKEVEVVDKNEKTTVLQPEDCSSQNSYELLLQQQRLFLQWQQEEKMLGTDPNEEHFDQVIELQRNNSPQQVIISQPLRRISDMKVQELKNECKKRQLPVSGAKPQLLERLRPFEKEIIGCSPENTPEPQAKEYPNTPDVIAISVANSELDSKMQPNMTVPSGFTNANVVSVLPTKATSRLVQTGIHDHQQSPLVLQVQNCSSQLVQLVDEKGEVVGMATVQYQNQPQEGRNSDVVSQITPQDRSENRVSADSLAAVQQMTTSQPSRAQQGQTKVTNNDNTYRFAQMGSGGQFTAVPSVERVDMSESPHSNSGLHFPPICSVASTNRSHAVSFSNQSEDSRSRASSFVLAGNIATQSLQRSPCTADQPGSSPNLPPGGETTQPETTVRVEQRRFSAEKLQLDPSDPASVLTPTTLQMHEEMLRSQHKLIESLEKEISTAQSTLKQQQQIILAAKKTQQKLREKQRHEAELQQGRGDQQWLRDLDIRHVNKQHIQQFLQHKIQVQNLQAVSAEHKRLKTTEARLQEELHVDQAVHDIVRLIKQDPRTALLIVQLLRKYQLERTQAERPQAHIQKPEDQTTSACSEKPSQFEENASQTSCIQSNEIPANCGIKPCTKEIFICEASGHQPNLNGTYFNEKGEVMTDKNQPVDMEEIFKSVLEDASRALKDDMPTQTVDCNVVANMDSPKYTAHSNQQWQYTTASVPLKDGFESSDTHQEKPNYSRTTFINTVQARKEDASLARYDSSSDVANNNQTFIESVNPYSSLDDVMAVVQADSDFVQAPEATFDRMDYGSDELADLLGDDWLNCAERSIAIDGQYAPNAHDIDDGRSTDPMSLAAPTEQMDSSQPDELNMNMDWLDEMLHHTPVAGPSFSP